MNKNRRKMTPPQNDTFLPEIHLAIGLRRYFTYSGGHFEVFRPAAATRCIDVGEIWRGGADLLHAKFK